MAIRPKFPSPQLFLERRFPSKHTRPVKLLNMRTVWVGTIFEAADTSHLNVPWDLLVAGDVFGKEG